MENRKRENYSILYNLVVTKSGASALESSAAIREKHKKYAFSAELLSNDDISPNTNPKRSSGRLTWP